MTQMKLTKTKAVVAAIAVICVLLAAAIFWSVRAAADKNAVGEMKIETAFCDLYYPAQWKDYVKIQEVDNTVQFSAEVKGHAAQPLFDVHFDQEDGVFYDRILAKDNTAVTVSLTVYPIEADAGWDQEYVDQLYGMQDDLNYLCARLPLASSQEETTPAQVPVYDDIILDTPYGLLLYSGRWEPYLRMAVSEEAVYSVEFYATVDDHPEQHLFDIAIGANVNGAYQMCIGDDGSIITLKLERYPFEPDDSWTPEQADIVYGMLDGAEQLVQELPLIKEMIQPDAEAVVVDTPYGQLCYPGEMKDVIRCVAGGDTPYTVAFYGTVEGQAEQHLYDVCFGTQVDNAYGTVTVGGKTVKVGINHYLFEPDENWSQEQANALYAMQETANQVLGMLQLTEETLAEETEDYSILTPYGELKYPGKWKNNIRINLNNADPYSVLFYGHADGGAEQLLFTVAFGGKKGIEVGTVSNAAGKAVNVYLIFEEITGEEGSSKDLLYAMQEDANYLIESLNTTAEE